MKIAIPALAIVLTTLTGCATPSNGAKLSVVEKDAHFYSASYIGGETGCFPPIRNRICAPTGSEAIYSPISPLDLKELNVSLSYSGHLLKGNDKEWLYLAAAEAALQLGYAKFTVVDEGRGSFCDFSYSANSYGTVGNGNYSGTAYMTKNVFCSYNTALTVILFKNEYDVENGVFYGVREKNLPLRLIPDGSLYFGTTPGLDFKQYNRVDNMSDASSRTSYSFMTFANAYQHYYNAAGLAHDLRAKLHVPEDDKVTIEIESTEKVKRQAKDVFQRNAVTLPR